MESLLKVLPMGVVMVAGPQIVSAIFLATSERAKRNSLSFLTGVALATTIGMTIAFLAGKVLHTALSSGGSSSDAIDYGIIALLLLLAVVVFLRRKKTEPPKWMSKLQTATPTFSFRLGFLLFLLMPTDIIGMVTVGSYLANHGARWWHTLLFVLLTVLLAAVPLIVLLLLGNRAQVILPKLRSWMNANSWVVNEIVIAFFLVMAVAGLKG